MTWFAKMAFLLGFFWDNNFQNHHIQIAPYLQDLGGGRVACGKNLGAQKSQACIVSTTFCRQPVLNIKKGQFYAYVGNSIFNINHGKLSFQHQFSISIFYVGKSIFWIQLFVIWYETISDAQSHEANSWFPPWRLTNPMATGTSLWPWWFSWDWGAPGSAGPQMTMNRQPVMAMSWPISKWLVNDEDMGQKKRKRYIYIYIYIWSLTYFWNMKDWWIQLMFFFGTIW